MVKTNQNQEIQLIYSDYCFQPILNIRILIKNPKNMYLCPENRIAGSTVRSWQSTKEKSGRNLGYEPLMRSINLHSSNCSCINY